MKWIEFEQKIKRKGIKLFTPLDIQQLLGKSKTAANFFLHRLKKQGYIIRLRKGLYQLYNDKLPDLFIANKLYEPSYISLEFALSYHNVIPETVYEITSITTKATRRFKALGKLFTYHHIKKQAYAGYFPSKQNGFTFFIAVPEKAFVDLNYFRLLNKQQPLNRFNKRKINLNKALYYAKLFNNKKLTDIIKTALK